MNHIRLILFFSVFIYLCSCPVIYSAGSSRTFCHTSVFPGPEAFSRNTRKVLAHYKDFLKSNEMYSLTAMAAYPRGDSHALYAIGDCTGDGIPELHIYGGCRYYIYTCQNDEITLFKAYEDQCSLYPLVPLKTGGFAGCEKSCTDENLYSYPRHDDSCAGHRQGDFDYYFYWKLDADGKRIPSDSHYFIVRYCVNGDPDKTIWMADGIECTREEWEHEAAPYLNMLKDETLQLSWNPLFPGEEWDYLDAVSEGTGDPALKNTTPEREAYEKVLSGDFSFVEDPMYRRHLMYVYEMSLDPDTGRSCWKYLLMDLNNDGVEELLILCNPETGSLDSDSGTGYFLSIPGLSGSIPETLCFSFLDSKAILLWADTEYQHGYFVPLQDGSILSVYDYAYLPSVTVKNLGPSSSFSSGSVFEENGPCYSQLIVDFDIWDESYYYFLDEYGVTGEGVYYFRQEYQNGTLSDPFPMSKEEWKALEENFESLLIPENAWKPASVIVPCRHQDIISVG